MTIEFILARPSAIRIFEEQPPLVGEAELYGMPLVFGFHPRLKPPHLLTVEVLELGRIPARIKHSAQRSEIVITPFDSGLKGEWQLGTETFDIYISGKTTSRLDGEEESHPWGYFEGWLKRQTS